MPNFKFPLIIFIAILVTALISGWSVYYWLSGKNATMRNQYATTINNLNKQLSDASNKSFDSVAQTELASSTDWYANLISQITKLKRVNDYDKKCTSYSKDGVILSEPQKIDCLTGNVTEDKISNLLYLKNKNLAIVLIPGAYGGSGFKLIKYYVASGTLEIAQREDVHGGKSTVWYKKMDAAMAKAPEQKEEVYNWFAPPNEIVSVDGNSIGLSGFTGDAGCEARVTYVYDLAKNYINIKGQCSSCSEEKENCETY